MRKLATAILGFGLFVSVNAETIIATGTLSIEDMKRMIIKLKQENELQSAKIRYLENKVAKLEKQLAGKITRANSSMMEGLKAGELMAKRINIKTYCTTANLNVRKGPGMNYEVFAWLKKGAVVSGTVKKGKWLKILNPNGWVSSKFLRECSYGREEK
ncbi:bacteriolytic enzyme (plasmid) [Persephonella marina EX-H1]|uniref:Bacteriolytic enzyme n=1 Tax=Persephonella marina (strain DSM 14350 / EX-H1) TaxID=123214 RepID=C0QUX2_PERMH|nr:SH3 domain-containing protein [Persephonella marina]ACO04975.1 bacteriolytic enzyme [Persephonella marina EX-H1]